MNQQASISVRTSEETRQKLEAIARREHRSVAQQAGLYIERALAEEAA